MDRGLLEAAQCDELGDGGCKLLAGGSSAASVEALVAEAEGRERHVALAADINVL